jgi:putative two-component system response regulator
VEDHHRGEVPVIVEPEPSTRARVLVVDDEPGNREMMTRLLEKHHYDVATVEDGELALQWLERAPLLPDLILLDVMMPGIDGFEVCRRIKNSELTRLIPVVMLTSLDARQHRIDGIKVGADDFLTKPVQFEELTARAANLVRLKRHTDDLESAQSVIVSLALTVEARDPYTQGHCQRLAAYALALGRAAGLDGEQLAALERGAYLHDVGKIGVSDAILLKREPLTQSEFEQMKTHTVIGERLCGEMRSLRPVRTIVRHHHERLDGSGYPDGLRGAAIPVTAQIVGIVDAYDAMTTTRPYRRALSEARACEELLRDAREGRLSDRLVAVFVGMDRQKALRFGGTDAGDPERLRHTAGGH